ncbi:PASTA domain-containing protein [Burkholderia sp. Bp8984]|uniref:PASTA domain-containing protein n=1 Tax=Burkholderia sp. Bp8984 TaxID=2184549 RepID=UPI0016242ACE|nr:PASTA domain-containing protein [Burkholderia sp. Bp8984]
MPNLIGLQYQDALAAMVRAGVRAMPLGYFQVDPVTVGWLRHSAQRPGFVLEQNPASGQSIAVNSSVLLTLSAHSMSVSTDGPVVQPQVPSDALKDGTGFPFILDESKLK